MHTPGPWKAYRADYQAGPNEDGPIYVVGPHEFHTVAKVRAGNEDDDLPAQTPSNAALIAAAPIMLAALEDIMNARWRPEGMREDHADAARAAIKAARGE